MSLVVNDFNTRFGNWVSSLDKEFDKILQNSGKKISQMGYPKVDISETDSNFFIEAAVPGLSKDDVKVEFVDGILSIIGESQKRTSNAEYHKTELHKSKFTRSFIVPDQVFDIEGIHAKIDNGILTLTIPKVIKKPPIEKKASITIN